MIRTSALTVLLFTLILLVSYNGDQEESDTERPNIVFSMTEDPSYQTLSACDNRFIETPIIDRIADDGVKFVNSFVGNYINAPYRATLLSGNTPIKMARSITVPHLTALSRPSPNICSRPGIKRYHGIRTGRYMLIHFYNEIDEWELYDLQEDSMEMNNLYGEEGYDELTGKLRDKLTQLQEKYEDIDRSTY